MKRTGTKRSTTSPSYSPPRKRKQAAKEKPSDEPERRSSRLKLKSNSKVKIVATGLYIHVHVEPLEFCQRDLIHGEEMRLAAVCDPVTNYFRRERGDVVVSLENSGEVRYELHNMDFYDNNGRIPNRGTLKLGQAIFRPQRRRPDCRITLNKLQ